MGKAIDTNILSFALTRMDVTTWTELPRKHAASQVSGYRECQSLSVVMVGSSEKSCVRCDQADDLLSLVADLQEEVEMLRSISESEKETLMESCSAIPERETGTATKKTPRSRRSVTSPYQAEDSSLNEE